MSLKRSSEAVLATVEGVLRNKLRVFVEEVFVKEVTGVRVVCRKGRYRVSCDHCEPKVKVLEPEMC